MTVLKAGAAELFLMATGPWLAWLPLGLLDRLAPPRLRPLGAIAGGRRSVPARGVGAGGGGAA